MSDSIQTQLIGAWQLTGMETTLPDGQVVHPFTETPMGMIIYTQSGHMSAHVVDPHRAKFASEDMSQGTDSEIRHAFDGFVSYCGTYSIDEASGKVLHHVQNALFPNWQGDIQERFFSFEDDKLILTTPPMPMGDAGVITTALIWKKA